MLRVNNEMSRMMPLFGQPDRHRGADRGHGFMGSQGGTHINGGSGDDTIIFEDRPQHSHGRHGHREPVAANEHGRIWNDPQFKGGDGGRFDVQGEAGKTYDLLSDSGLQLNGRFDTFNGNGTAVGATGLTVTGADGKTSEVAFNKDGTATLDGQAMEAGKTYTLADGGTAEMKGNKLTINTAEGYTIEQEAKKWGDGFINIDVQTGRRGVDHGQMPGGLLGQTFDADDVARNGRTGHGAQGEGAIDGVVGDYETDGLFKKSQAAPADAGGVVVNGGSGDDEIIINAPVDGPIVVDGGSGDDVIIIGPDNSKPAPPPEPVAANETGKIWGDPHFIGGDGGTYDVQGEAGKIYDLLSDEGLQFRGRYDGWGDGITVVGETGLTVGEGSLNSDNVNFRKDGSAQINGQLMEQGREYELADGGTAKLEGKTLTITTAEGYTVKQTAQGSGDKAYIDIEVNTGADGVDHGKMPGGLLGQTFDADNVARNGKTGAGAQGEGAIDGNVGDYERNALDPINDNRGQNSQTEESGSEFEQWMEKFQELFDKFMKMMEGFFNQGPKSIPQPKQETQTDAGSGDDRVEIRREGNHNVNLGSGDDKAYVNFGEGATNNRATIHGGSGDDTVTLAGKRSDYTVKYDDGYATYTDKNGNSVEVAYDVEHVEFEDGKMPDGGIILPAWDPEDVRTL